MAPHGWLLLLLLLLLVQETGSHGEMKDMEMRSASSTGSCVCQLLLNASEKLCFQLKEPTCPENLSIWDKNPLDGPLGEMNGTSCRLQESRTSNVSLDSAIRLFCSDNTTTVKSDTKFNGLSSSLGTATMAIATSIGVVVLILLLVGLLFMTLKKWRHERLFKRQLRHQSYFSHQSDLPGHADAIYSNTINLAPWKEEEYAIYANMPPFDRARRASPDQVEYASIVFH